MTRYEIVPATADHAAALAPVMRAADVDEIWASHRAKPLDALLGSLRASRDPQAALADGRVFCLFGVATATTLALIGAPWLLGSEELPRHFRAFLPGSRAYIRTIREQHPFLRNWVDARNAQSIRWLRWLGFDILPPVPFGVDKMPFHEFTMVRG